METLTKPKTGSKQKVIQVVFNDNEYDQYSDYKQLSSLTGIPLSQVVKIAGARGFADKRFREVVDLLS